MKKILGIAGLMLASTVQAQSISIQGGTLDGLDRSTIAYETKPYHIGGRLWLQPEVNFTALGKNGDSVYGLAAIPMFRYSLGKFNIDLGIGVAVFNKTSLDDLNFSTAFQFSDNIGLSYQLGKDVAIGYRFTHFSNANLKRPNPGLDTQQLTLTVKF